MRGLLIALGAVLVVAPSAGLAQPYAAAGGFDRPFLLGRTRTLPGIAVAADREGVYAFWDDGEGIVRASLSAPGGPPDRILEGRGFRTVHAATAGGDLALAWVRREPDTGRTAHRLRWRGQEVNLIDAGQAYLLELAGGPEGPVALYARGVEGRSTLILRPWGSPERVLRRSTGTISRYHLAVDARGNAHVSWLEGFNDPNAVGVAASEWTAYYLKVVPGGEPGTPVELGPATNPGVAFRTAVGLDGDTPVVQWPTPDGLLVAAPGQEPVVLGPGTALGFADGHAFWIEGSSILRSPLGRGGTVPTNVLWSPTAPELAVLVESAGHRFLAWYGPDFGGGFALRGAHDLAPITLGWRDRIAARMGWSPWTFWEALGGQLLVSLLTGVLATMALSPLFWLASLFVARRAGGKAGTGPGILISTAFVIALATLAWLASALDPDAGRALPGTPLAIAAALVAGALITWLTLRRADNEIQLHTLASACLHSAVSLSILSFVYFRAWTELWGRII